MADPPTPPSQQPNFARRQPSFSHNQPSVPLHQQNVPLRQPNFAHRQPSFAHNQPNLAHCQPSFAHSHPNFPRNQPNFTHRQPSFAPSQTNFPSPPEFPNVQQQQQHLFLTANQPALPGYPHFLQFSTPSNQSHLTTSTNASFPASIYQQSTPFNNQRFIAQASRPGSNHPYFSTQQQRSSSRTSSLESLSPCNRSPSTPVPLRQAATNRPVTISTSAADSARRQNVMQTNFTPANDGTASFIGGREIHNAIRQLHETLNEVRNEMMAIHDKVDQKIYSLHREMFAMHERNNGSIERVIKMLNYS